MANLVAGMRRQIGLVYHAKNVRGEEHDSEHGSEHATSLELQRCCFEVSEVHSRSRYR